VLGNLFSRLTHASQIPFFLQAYQMLRYERTKDTQASSRLNQHIFHLHDGPDQEARDRCMREVMIVARKEAGFPVECEEQEQACDASAGGNGGNPNQWADKAKNVKQFSYDADAEADKWWREEGERSLKTEVLAL
jgi:salicylate hydroxylase